jgi:outer membrane biosynthesis protein TonB
MRRSLAWSAALHLLALVLAVLGLPRLWDTKKPVDTPMVVEVVKIDDQTTSKDMPKPAAKEKPLKQTPPPPKAQPRTADIPPPPEPPKVTERPAPDAEKVPVLKKAVPKKTPKKEKKPETATPQPPKAIAQARPKRRPPQPKDDFLQSVLRDVAPEERGEKAKEKEKEQPPAPAEKVVQNRAPLDAVATMSEIDAIRHQIEKCWIIPAGARDADKLVVSIRIWVNPDGTVRDARILDQGRMADPFFRSAAESARRAVLNERCSPLPIPPKKYDQFKEMVLDFNPREATGS